MKKTEIDIQTERILAYDFVVLTFSTETAEREGFCQALLMRMAEAAEIVWVTFFKARAAMSLIRGDLDIWQVRLRGMTDAGRPQKELTESSWIFCWPDKRPDYKRWCVLAGRIRSSVLDQTKALNEATA